MKNMILSFNKQIPREWEDSRKRPHNQSRANTKIIKCASSIGWYKILVAVLMPRRSKQLKLGRVDPSKRDEEQKSL